MLTIIKRETVKLITQSHMLHKILRKTGLNFRHTVDRIYLTTMLWCIRLMSRLGCSARTVVSHQQSYFLWKTISTICVISASAFHEYELTLIPVWISDYIHYQMWDEITNPFPNFNGATVEVWEWISNLFYPIFHWSCHYLCMLGLKLTHVSKRGSRNERKYKYIFMFPQNN